MTVRIDCGNRWDTLALTRQLSTYRWFLFQESSECWKVCLQLDLDGDLPDDLRRRIQCWLHERRLPTAVIHAGDYDYIVTRSGRTASTEDEHMLHRGDSSFRLEGEGTASSRN